ncbi:ParB/RepB/Spo0J family partition protein [Candidatus Saccharibacteria bacterium]|nr:ParB/RepB/Spo0J family partition protein [Candidatus Saccharibacteria bacterium]
MSAKKTGGLGRGIDSLISTNFDRSILTDENERVQKLFIKDISPLKNQPRTLFDTNALNELAASIKQYGVLQPLIVSKDGNSFTIIAGERRWRAAQIAGLEKVPAIVRGQKQQEKLEIALIENVQRVDLSPLETAVAVEKLHQDFNLTYNDIAKRLGKASTTINNTVRLLQLPKEALLALQENKITEGHARAILSVKDSPKNQLELLKNILSKHWSVRQAEQYVISLKQGAKTSTQLDKKMASTTPETIKLGNKLKTNVSIKRTARGGRVEIHFKNDDQLKELLDNLNK